MVHDGTGTEHFVILVGVRKKNRIYQAHGHPLLYRTLLETGRFVTCGSRAHLHGQCTAIVG